MTPDLVGWAGIRRVGSNFKRGSFGDLSSGHGEANLGSNPLPATQPCAGDHALPTRYSLSRHGLTDLLECPWGCPNVEGRNHLIGECMQILAVQAAL